jgi:hypothetical protein
MNSSSSIIIHLTVITGGQCLTLSLRTTALL